MSRGLERDREGAWAFHAVGSGEFLGFSTDPMGSCLHPTKREAEDCGRCP
ncbi:MAG: hypothetical protein MAG715_00353 [Methanonatronarchaeales archaeon]|nr:hypothetical protein [Methanonatronarchaeales archaeon]